MHPMLAPKAVLPQTRVRWKRRRVLAVRRCCAAREPAIEHAKPGGRVTGRDGPHGAAAVKIIAPAGEQSRKRSGSGLTSLLGSAHQAGRYQVRGEKNACGIPRFLLGRLAADKRSRLRGATTPQKTLDWPWTNYYLATEGVEPATKPRRCI